MTILDAMDGDDRWHPGLPRALGAVLVLVVALFHAPGLDGPLRDGQGGNCGAMFALFARNAEAVGWLPSRGVPIVNPVPPGAGETTVHYAHHPPGLPWLVELSSAISGELVVGARVVALLLTLASVWLLADTVARAASLGAGLAAGALLAGLPSGWHHGLLVNYETVALPPLLLVVRATVLGRGSGLVAGALAGLADYIALVPLLFTARRATERGERGRRWRRSLATGLGVVVAWGLVARSVAPGSLGETLHQAALTTPLAPDFTWPAWLDAAAAHLGALYGWALVPAVVGAGFVLARGGRAAQLVGVLVGVGAFNVVVFGRHAIGHEHFWLLFAPGVAASLGAALPAGLGTRGEVGRAVLVLSVLAVSALAALDASPARAATRQTERARDLAALTEPSPDAPVVYVLPSGASLVFLAAAERHVATQPVADVDAARATAAALRARLGLAPGATVVVTPNDAEVPAWATSLDVVARGEHVTLRALPHR